MALTKLDPNVIGQDSTGTGKITSAGGSVSIDSSGNVRIANASANSVLFAANGNVSIGSNTSPVYPLTVMGIGYIANNVYIHSNDNPAASYGLSIGQYPKRLALGYDVTNNYGYLISTNTGTEYRPLAIQQYGGNTGFGTANPGAQLDVYSSLTGTTVNSNRVAIFGTNGTGRDVNITIGNRVDDATTIGNLGGVTYLLQGATERMRIDTSGRVIVGANSSIFTNSKLQVTTSAGPALGVQSTTGTEYAGGFWNNASGTVKLVSFYTGSSGNPIGEVAANSSLLSINNTNAGSGLSINNSGYVGIGNTSPVQKLHVQGYGHAQSGFTVTGSSQGFSTWDVVGNQDRFYTGTSGSGTYLLLWPKSNDGAFFSGIITLDNYDGPSAFELHIHNYWNNNGGIAGTGTTKYGTGCYVKRVTYNGATWVALQHKGAVNRGWRLMGIMNNCNVQTATTTVTDQATLLDF